MHDWLEWVGPPWPEEPKARIALWMHDDDYFEDYYLSAWIWRKEMAEEGGSKEMGEPL